MLFQLLPAHAQISRVAAETLHTDMLNTAMLLQQVLNCVIEYVPVLVVGAPMVHRSSKQCKRTCNKTCLICVFLDVRACEWRCSYGSDHRSSVFCAYAAGLHVLWCAPPPGLLQLL